MQKIEQKIMFSFIPDVSMATSILYWKILILPVELKKCETANGVRVIKTITQKCPNPKAEFKLQQLPWKQIHQSQVKEQEVLKSFEYLSF